MPFQSEAQRKLFFAAAQEKAKNGPAPEVAKKFIEDSYGQLSEAKNRVRKRAKEKI